MNELTPIDWDTPPSDDVYHRMQAACRAFWAAHYPEPESADYRAEKYELIDRLPNVGSNFMTLWQMFDASNQARLFITLDRDIQAAIINRII